MDHKGEFSVLAVYSPRKDLTSHLRLYGDIHIIHPLLKSQELTQSHTVKKKTVETTKSVKFIHVNDLLCLYVDFMNLAGIYRTEDKCIGLNEKT